MGTEKQPDETRSVLGTILRWGLTLVGLLFVLFLATVLLDCTRVIRIYPEYSESYLCAVCGRWKHVTRRYGMTSGRYSESPATPFCDRFVGDHDHVWVHDYTFIAGAIWEGGARQVGDSFAYLEVPIAYPQMEQHLARLEGTPYLEPVVKALCDVEDYYSYVARDVLVRASLDLFYREAPSPSRAQLDAWWEEYGRFFEIEHDPAKALPKLRNFEAELGWWAEIAARQTLDYHEGYGVPTIGAVEKLQSQRKGGALD